MSTVVLDYGLGNIGSIQNMLRKIGHTATLSCSPEVIKNADRLILPGVGSFDAGMAKLEEYGLVELLNDEVVIKKKPILGICLGMQLLMNRSDEGKRNGLSFIPGSAVRFKADELGDRKKVPHMGWNFVRPENKTALFTGVDERSKFYFVHSYYASVEDKYIISSTDYGKTFASAIGNDNILGVQFHPEKSHKHGMALLKNYVENYG